MVEDDGQHAGELGGGRCELGGRDAVVVEADGAGVFPAVMHNCNDDDGGLWEARMQESTQELIICIQFRVLEIGSSWAIDVNFC